MHMPVSKSKAAAEPDPIQGLSSVCFSSPSSEIQVMPWTSEAQTAQSLEISGLEFRISRAFWFAVEGTC